MTDNNIDMTSIRGTLLTIATGFVSLMDIEIMTKLGLMGIGIVSGITTIVYNIKKIKKLKNEER
jgi:hypothetical protein